MAQRGEKVDKHPNKININVLKIQNLKSPKAEPLNVFLRFEYNDNQFSESPKFDIGDVTQRQIDFVAILGLNATDPSQIDDLGQKPVLITLLEAVPKDKKQKEDKSTAIGQAILDLWSLLKGITPSLVVNVTVDQPLVPSKDEAQTNSALITIEGLYSPPDAWVGTGANFVYTATLPMPLADEKETNVVFTNGNLKNPNDITNKQKRWPDARGIATANGIYIPGRTVGEEQIEDEQGELRSKDDKEFRTNAEKMKPQVVWNMERRCFFLPNGSQVLRDRITKFPYLPIEVARTTAPTAGKGKKDEEAGMSYHGVAYVETVPLLYPGTTRLRGAFKIVPYNESEYKAKVRKLTANAMYAITKRSNNLIDDAMRIAGSLYDRAWAQTPKKDAKISDKPSMTAVKKKPEAGDENVATTEAQQYVEHNSYIIVEIAFEKPIIEKRKLYELTRKIAELIPPRPNYPVKVNSAQKAVEDYHSQIKNVAGLVLEEYRKLCGEDSTSDVMPNDQKRRKLLYELNSTGKYFAFKEQLKHSVVKIVREKFLKTSKFDNQDELQVCMQNQLYVFLLDEMHNSLNSTLNIEESEPIPTLKHDDAQLRIFALEAESNGDFLSAAQYYQERIAQDRANLNAWLDYAAFHLLVNDITKAEECLKECIAIDQTNSTATILYAVLNAILERNDIAELFFETAISEDSENVVACALYGIFQKHIGNETNSQITLSKAEKTHRLSQMAEDHANQQATPTDEKKEEEEKEDKEESLKSSESQLNVASKSRLSRKKVKSATNEQVPTRKSQDTTDVEKTTKKSIFIKAAEFLLKYNMATWAEKSLAYEIVTNGGKDQQVEIALTRSKILQQDLTAAETHITQALSLDYENSEAWNLWGHIKYLQLDFPGAKGRYQRTLAFSEKPSDIHILYVRLGSILLAEESYAEAKDIFLRACRHQPTCTTWLGVGVACYRMNQYDDAEEALTEANFLNNRNAEVWAYLTLICLQTKRTIEAENAFKYAIKLDLPPGPLMDEITAVQREMGFGNPSF
ncbi:unnamed protein product [Didymodactylos carnosus]|uniref:Cilia- and flagella-associated protein 70 n=1 Tax=Didymodactylos carnosus TaxID=1234261 RepID=A0A813W8I0_9BILA|nr:unnamed protein product [Didymodactylos carnosus]CAF3636267.1 unnamed protein product [Didymodactylos carnosus]